LLKEKTEILFLGSGPYALDRRDVDDKFKYFSKYYSCTLLTPVNRPTKRMTKLRETTVHKNFRLIPFTYNYTNFVLRNILIIYNLIAKALLHYYVRKQKFSVVISGNPLMTGFCAFIIARLTGVKLIVEVNGNFEQAFNYGKLGKPEIEFIDKIKQKVAKYLIKFNVKRADLVRLLYGGQLDFIDRGSTIGRNNYTVFPDYASIGPFLSAKKIDKRFILLVGFPWYLKGVDILIQAFNKISDDFPDYRLKIVGYCPEGKGYYENLAKNNQKVELCDPVPHKEIVSIMAACSLFVLASRTEAMGRVLLEAMASRKPIVASNVDGIPTVIKDGFNGLLFEKENVDDLAGKIKRVLSEREFAEKLANNGYRYVQRYLSGDSYIQKYNNAIESILHTSRKRM